MKKRATQIQPTSQRQFYQIYSGHPMSWDQALNYNPGDELSYSPEQILQDYELGRGCYQMKQVLTEQGLDQDLQLLHLLFLIKKVELRAKYCQGERNETKLDEVLKIFIESSLKAYLDANKDKYEETQVALLTILDAYKERDLITQNQVDALLHVFY
mmetsp:Transcript_27956/g.27000  ORF Transcript_27956/g.27000 Transcript_27956/m.27000 type:complete len:157 (-) Transcript_27956:6-476(-)